MKNKKPFFPSPGQGCSELQKSCLQSQESQVTFFSASCLLHQTASLKISSKNCGQSCERSCCTYDVSPLTAALRESVLLVLSFTDRETEVPAPSHSFGHLDCTDGWNQCVGSVLTVRKWREKLPGRRYASRFMFFTIYSLLHATDII